MIPGSNPAIKTGATVQFVFLLTDAVSGKVLPCAFQDPADPSAVRPFEYALRPAGQQRGNVSITNNVINPAAGQVANLQYVLQKSGNVTITVFDLSGSIITVLVRGNQAAGSYTASWDGKNRGGRACGAGHLLHQGGRSGLRRDPQGARRPITKRPHPSSFTMLWPSLAEWRTFLLRTSLTMRSKTSVVLPVVIRDVDHPF